MIGGRKRKLSVWLRKGMLGYGNLLYPIVNRWRSISRPKILGPGCDPREGKIPFYISFDLDYTKDIKNLPALFDRLNQYNVKASFACIGKFIEMFPEEHRTILLEGHEIVNHTYSHPDNDELNPHSYYTELSREEQFEEIQKMQAVCEKILQYKPIGFRLPHFGNVVEVDMPNLFRQLKSLGMIYDTSLLKFNIPNGKADIYETDVPGITEFSINTCPYHPFTACDSWHIFRSDRIVYRGIHHFKTFEETVKKLVEDCFHRQEMINIYLDPMDVVENNVFDYLMELAIPYCDFHPYRDFFKSSKLSVGKFFPS